MLRVTLAVLLLTVSLPEIVRGQVPGYLGTLPYHAQTPGVAELLDLSEDQKSKFRSMSVEMRLLTEDVFGFRRRRGKPEPNQQLKVQTINYDLWQQVCEILDDEEKVKAFHLSFVQNVLRNFAAPQQVATLLGAEQLTAEQTRELTQAFRGEAWLIDNSLAKRRRELEDQHLTELLPKEKLDELRGEEFHWKTKPPENSGIANSPFGDMQIYTMPFRVAAHDDVLDSFGFDADKAAKVQQIVAKVIGSSQDGPFGGNFGMLMAGRGQGGDPEGRIKQLFEQLEKQEKEVFDNLKEHLSDDQISRVKQIALQIELRSYNYQRVARAAGVGKPADPFKPNARGEYSELAAKVSQEIEYAKAQMMLDRNAELFDEVAGTKLASAVGRLDPRVLQSSYGIRNIAGQQDLSRLEESITSKYGSEPTSTLTIPTSLTQPPARRVEWNPVEIPDGWTLKEAQADLEKKQGSIASITNGAQKWGQQRDAYQQDLHQAMRNQDPDGARALRAQFEKEYGMRSRMRVREEFNEALKIAQKELIKARAVVRKLGGDPGPMEETRMRLRF